MSASTSPQPWVAKTQHSMNPSAALEVHDANGQRVAVVAIRRDELPNALLIAAAPELRQCLAAFVEAHAGAGEEDLRALGLTESMIRARAALAKSEGR